MSILSTWFQHFSSEILSVKNRFYDVAFATGAYMVMDMTPIGDMIGKLPVPPPVQAAVTYAIIKTSEKATLMTAFSQP